MGKRQTGWDRLFGVALVTAGCDAQVGTEYSGEPLLSVQGQVVLAGGNAAELTPVIAFNTETGYAVVNAEVSGAFPAEFRLDVVEPPPRDAEVALGGGPERFASGVLAVAPRDHSDRIPRFIDGEEEDCSDGGLTCIREVKKCVPEAGCITRTLSCSQELCPIVYESGDARIEQDPDASTGQALENQGNLAYHVTQSCNESLGCYRTIRRCDVASAGPHARVWSDGSLDRCELLSETSDSSLALQDLLENVAVGYGVVYLTEPQEFLSYGRLDRGYHLFRAVEGDEPTRIASLICMLDARTAAVDAYNQENGTSYGLFEAPNEVVHAEIGARARELGASCPVLQTWRVVESPLAEDLTFVIGSENRSLL